MGIFRKHPGGPAPIVGKPAKYDYTKIFGHEFVPPFEKKGEAENPEEKKDAGAEAEPQS
jgi:hypothetical protein